MAAGILVPLEEYLSRTYEPDMDYDDGVLIGRNVGKRKHSRSQILIGTYVCEREKEWGITGYVEQRLQVAPRRFRVVDICASLATAPKEEIFTTPPLFTIEIHSDGDDFAEVEGKARLYLAMGVRYVWSVDPDTARCWRHHPDGSMSIVEGSVLRVDGTPIEIPVAELLQQI
jgi:Uma2 family endonuclease